MPPGGHIEKGEKPVDTVRREFKEELDFELTNEPITLFNLTIKDINKPHHPCKRHWDLWYLVEMKEEIDFNYCRREYYSAGWFSIKVATDRIRFDLDYKNTIKKLGKMES